MIFYRMKRNVGLVLSIVGLIILVLGIKPVYSSVSFVQSVSPIILLIVGIVVAAVGIIIAKSASGSKKITEVPIYHGKDVVGYRRMGKKKRR